MNATLYEVISLGNIIQKCYYLDTPVILDNREVENLIVEEYNFNPDLKIHFNDATDCRRTRFNSDLNYRYDYT
jgi:hypothetical protein